MEGLRWKCMTGAGRDIDLQMGLKFSEENLH